MVVTSPVFAVRQFAFAPLERNMRVVNSKLLFAATFVSLALTAVASAADLPARTTYTKAPEYVPMSCAWCGWYIGANGGGTWGGRTGSLTGISPAFAAFEISELVGSSLGSNHGGGFGGGQFGYNWVMSSWLVGFEADIQGADIGRAGTVSAFIPDDREVTGVSTGRDHIDWFGTARGRLGFTTGNVLFYGTGGLAFGGVHNSASSTIVSGDETDIFAGSTSETRFGWAAGAGLEWMFVPNWSLKAEYLHVDLGSSSVTLTVAGAPPDISATYRFHHDFDSARAGVNYHFGGPIVAKY